MASADLSRPRGLSARDRSRTSKRNARRWRLPLRHSHVDAAPASPAASHPRPRAPSLEAPGARPACRADTAPHDAQPGRGSAPRRACSRAAACSGDRCLRGLLCACSGRGPADRRRPAPDRSIRLARALARRDESSRREGNTHCGRAGGAAPWGPARALARRAEPAGWSRLDSPDRSRLHRRRPQRGGVRPRLAVMEWVRHAWWRGGVPRRAPRTCGRGWR
jgi:hypothetical protein